MTKNKPLWIRISAIMIIAMIISMPIYSAAAIGALFNTQAYGQDKIAGYAKNEDTVTIETIAPGIDSPVRIKTAAGNVFNQCFDLGSGTEKKCTYQFGTMGLVTTRPMSLVIYQYDTAGNQIATSSASLIIDYSKPKINAFSVAESTIGYGDSTFNIKATDTACDECAATQCSGIQKIVLYDQTNEAVSKEKVYTAPGCNVQEEIKWEPAKKTGRANICAVVYDRFGQFSDPTCVSYNKDVTAPPPQGISFVANGKEIKWVGASPLNAKMTITIGKGTQIVQSSITAKTTELNQYAVVEVKQAPGLCINYGDTMSCEWNSVMLRAKTSLTGNVYLSVRDIIGNEALTGIPFSIGFDKTAPILTDFKSLHKEGENNYLAAENNTFMAIFTEQESGFYGTNVLADFQSINSEYPSSGLRPDECIYDGAKWTCLWKNIKATSADGTTTAVSLLSAYDDAGNAATGTLSAAVIVDKTPPEMTKLEVAVGDITENACPVSGDVLTYRLLAKEVYAKLYVVVNASMISEHQGLLTADCTPPENTNQQNQDIWKCEIGIDKLRSGYLKAPVTIMLEDAAGNRAELPIEQEVCESDTGTLNPNFVQLIDLTVVPEKVDRHLASKIDVPVFVKLKFAKSSSTYILAYADDNCVNTQYVASAYSPFVLNPFGKEPMLALRLKSAGEYTDMEKVNVNCKLSLKIRVGSKVYKNPEVEWVNLDVPLYNLPVGQMDDAVKAQITAEVGEINGLKGRIASEKESNKGFKTICMLLQMIDMANQIMQVIRQFQAATVDAACQAEYQASVAAVNAAAIPGAAPAAAKDIANVDSGSTIGCSGLAASGPGVFAPYISFCTPAKIFQDKLSTFVLLLAPLRMMCAAHSCQMCNPEVFGNMAGSMAGDLLKVGNDNMKSSEGLPLSDLMGAMGGQKSQGNDPFANIHAAEACMCSPAKIYNYKKLRQIKCLKVRCLQKTGMIGMPTQICQIGYDQRVCVYFEGTGSKTAGMGFDKFLAAIVKGVAIKLASKYLQSVFFPETKPAAGTTAAHTPPTDATKADGGLTTDAMKESKAVKEGVTDKNTGLTRGNTETDASWNERVDKADKENIKQKDKKTPTACKCTGGIGPGKPCAEGGINAMIQAISTAMQVLQLIKGLDTPKDKEDPKLEGTDYCEGLEGVEPL